MSSMYEMNTEMLGEGVKVRMRTQGERYDLSNIIPVDENMPSFHEYLRHCYKSGRSVFRYPSAIK